jgi:hypothetical protein
MVALKSPWLTSVGFGCRFASRIIIGVPFTPVRFVLAVTTSLVHEGFNTWISTQQRKGRTKVFTSVKITLKKSIRWVKKGRRKKDPNVDDVRDVVRMDAGMKYKELAERRLNAARSAFEVAAVELSAAERGVKDAEKYVESMRAKKEHEFNDVVLVEHAS